METMNSFKTEKEPISFYQLFNKLDNGISHVEIPIIQRDYAQGRQSSEIKRIRKQFLDVLYNALIDDSSPIQLDFVYGSIEKEKLVPLDGQQRLTTLFLLHWYIARHEKIVTSDLDFLRRFSYHTRYSSERFCIFLNDLEEFELNEVSLVSEYITDQYAFIRSWQNDPTVSSMLVMLDNIHDKFKNTTGLWDSLVNMQQPAISFYFLSLDDLQTTDTLYVKMNSRGKPLTEFEHFKSFFQSVVKKICGDKMLDSIAQKFDGVWTDLFWKFRGDNDIIDEEFIRYFRFVSEILSWKNGIEILIDDDFFDITEKVYSNVENIEFLVLALDVWCTVDIEVFFFDLFTTEIEQSDKLRIFSSSINYFNDCCQSYSEYAGRNRKFSLNDTLMLYSVLIYQMNKQIIEISEFRTRLRIVRNLVLNSQFEIREKTMGDILQDVDKVIIKGLIQIDDKSFNKLQKEEENRKIDWRQLNPDLVGTLNRLEDHPLLRGATSLIDFNNVTEFTKRVTAFYAVFGQTSELSFSMLRQVLLSLGDYGQLFSWRYSYGGNNEGTWRDVLIPSNQRQNFDKTQEVVQSLLDSLDLSKGIENQCECIVSQYLNSATTQKDWRYYIVKYDSMRDGAHGMYCWRDSWETPDKRKNTFELHMMNTPSSLNGKHWDPFLYTLKNEQPLFDSFELEDYGGDLYIPQLHCYVKCVQSGWAFYDSERRVVYKYNVPQNGNGVDQKDRIKLITEFIKNSIEIGGLPTGMLFD